MDEVVEVDEVVDDEHIHLFRVGLDAELVDVYQVLAEQDGPYSQPIFVIHLMLFYYELALQGFGSGLNLAMLGDVVDAIGREVVAQVGLV